MDLRIKKDKKLEELKAFGFKKIKYHDNSDGQSKFCNHYCLIDKPYVEGKVYGNYQIELVVDSERKLKTINYPEQIDWDWITQIIYKLTKADMLELVKEDYDEQ